MRSKKINVAYFDNGFRLFYGNKHRPCLDYIKDSTSKERWCYTIKHLGDTTKEDFFEKYPKFKIKMLSELIKSI